MSAKRIAAGLSISSPAPPQRVDGHAPRVVGYASAVAEQTPLKEQLEEIGAQLAWVRDYL